MKNEVKEEKIVNLYKPAGWTPLQVIEKLKELRPELKDIKVACAGRLDPMAEGVLIVLAGEALKRFNEFCGLDKVYEAEILFGFKSDSGDVMGMVEADKARRHGGTEILRHGDIEAQRHKGMEEVEKVMNELRGELSLPVPVYSSWRVQGKPLYWWARQGKLNEIEIPLHECTISSSQWLGARSIDIEELRKSVMERLNRVQGDFRQEDIKRQWESILNERYEPYQSVKMRVHCSSGTYIRSIVQWLGKRLGVGAMLYRLTRTRVGGFEMKDTMRLEHLIHKPQKAN